MRESAADIQGLKDDKETLFQFLEIEHGLKFRPGEYQPAMGATVRAAPLFHCGRCSEASSQRQSALTGRGSRSPIRP